MRFHFQCSVKNGKKSKLTCLSRVFQNQLLFPSYHYDIHGRRKDHALNPTPAFILSCYPEESHVLSQPQFLENKRVGLVTSELLSAVLFNDIIPAPNPNPDIVLHKTKSKGTQSSLSPNLATKSRYSDQWKATLWMFPGHSTDLRFTGTEVMQTKVKFRKLFCV